MKNNIVQISKKIAEYQAYREELFNCLSDLGCTPTSSEMDEVERIIKNGECALCGDIISDKEKTDNVNHPVHYSETVPGIECIEVTRHFNFNRGNAIKYIWRAGYKSDEIEDLKKAVWYLNDEINKLQEVSK